MATAQGLEFCVLDHGGMVGSPSVSVAPRFPAQKSWPLSPPHGIRILAHTAADLLPLSLHSRSLDRTPSSRNTLLTKLRKPPPPTGHPWLGLALDCTGSL